MIYVKRFIKNVNYLQNCFGFFLPLEFSLEFADWYLFATAGTMNHTNTLLQLLYSVQISRTNIFYKIVPLGPWGMEFRN